MWAYEKKLQYPVKITNPDPALAKVIITQLGGPDCKRRACSGAAAPVCGLLRCSKNGRFSDGRLQKSVLTAANRPSGRFSAVCFSHRGHGHPGPPPICLMIW